MNTVITTPIIALDATGQNRTPNQFDLHYYDGRINGDTFCATVEFDIAENTATVSMTFYGHSAVVGDVKQMRSQVKKFIKAKYPTFI